MSKLDKVQLKNLIRKEYIDILKETKYNEAYFNRIAYEHVINNLIKEEVLEENWQDRAVQRQASDWDRQASDLGYGESWNDARGRLDMPEWLPQSNLQNDPGAMPPPVPGADPDAAAMGVNPDAAAELPPDYQNKLVTMSERAPTEFRNNIKNVGNEVFNSLKQQVGGYKTNEDLAILTLSIIEAVIGAMGSAGGRSWTNPITGEIEEVDPTTLPSNEEAAKLAPGIASGIFAEVYRRLLGK